jgi:hypothetical protein
MESRRERGERRGGELIQVWTVWRGDEEEESRAVTYV